MTALPQPDPDFPARPGAPPAADAARGEPPAPSDPAPPAAVATPLWPPGGTPADPWPWAPGGTAPARIRLTDPADLIAAIPVLIGFHPEDSLVLVGLAGPELRGRVGLTLRLDLPQARVVRRVCDDAVSVLAGSDPARAVVVVVGGGAAVPAARNGPRRDVAVAARRALRWAGIDPMAVLWTSGTRAGDRWSCYPLPGQACGCTGTVPDPGATPVAVAAAVQGGRAVLPDRAAVLAQLDGDGTDRARRSRLRARAGAGGDGGVTSGAGAVSGAGAGADPDGGGRATRDPGGLLDVALAEAAEGRLVIDDRLALDFRAAFADPGFRDEALRRSLGPDAPHAEQLWAALTRALPGAGRADTAALLAVCALLRGDGALAGLAVERALADRPGHVVATVVDTSLRAAVTPGATPGPYAGPAGLRHLLDAVLAGAEAAGDTHGDTRPEPGGETSRGSCSQARREPGSETGHVGTGVRRDSGSETQRGSGSDHRRGPGPAGAR